MSQVEHTMRSRLHDSIACTVSLRIVLKIMSMRPHAMLAALAMFKKSATCTTTMPWQSRTPACVHMQGKQAWLFCYPGGATDSVPGLLCFN